MELSSRSGQPEWTDETRGPFDLVVCVQTLEHVENPRQVLRSIRSLLRVGDRLLVSTPNVTHPHSRLKMFLLGAPYIFGPKRYYEPLVEVPRVSRTATK